TFHAAIQHLRGDSAAAVGELRAVLAEEPNSQFANYYLGLALLGSGKPDEAEAAFTDCIHLDSKFVYALEQLSALHLQKHDWDEALEYAQKVISAVPQSADGYVLAAQAYLERGDARRAENILQEIQKRMPNLPQVRESL